MPNYLLQHGAEWLADQRHRHLTRPALYHALADPDRLPEPIVIDVTLGQTNYEVADEAGFTTGGQATDVLVSAAQLGIDPMPGDVIEIDGHRHEVIALGEDFQGWRFAEPQRLTYRIHTKSVNSVPTEIDG